MLAFGGTANSDRTWGGVVCTYVYRYKLVNLVMCGCQGDMVLTNNKAVLMSPLQLHCVNKRMTLPLGSSGQWVGSVGVVNGMYM